MSAPDKWVPRVTVDGSVEYDGEGKSLFFPYDEWAAGNAALGQQHRVDVLVKGGDGTQPVWLVEVKDFRFINHPPGEGNTVHIAEKLEEKLTDTLDFLDSSSASVPDGVLFRKNGAPRYFGYHCEMPKGIPSPYFPKGYPLNQMQDLESRSVCQRVSQVVLLTSESINAREVIPWKAALNDSRKGKGCSPSSGAAS